MGKFTIDRRRCDRCGCVHDKWYKPSEARALVSTVSYDTSGGVQLEWRELCIDCNRLVGDAVKAMIADAKAARSELDAPETSQVQP